MLATDLDGFPRLPIALRKPRACALRKHETPLVLGLGTQQPIARRVEQPDITNMPRSTGNFAETVEEPPAQVVQDDDAPPAALFVEDGSAEADHRLQRLLDHPVLHVEIEGRHVDFTAAQRERFAYVVAIGFVLQVGGGHDGGLAIVPVDPHRLPACLVDKPDLVVESLA